MPRPKGSFKVLPSYRLHKPSGRAVVTIDGSDIYLGAFNSPESRAKYDKVVGEWLSRGRSRGSNIVSTTSGATVEQVLAAFWVHVQDYYRHSERERRMFRRVMGFVRRLYGDTPVASFDAAALRAVREHMLLTPCKPSNVGETLSRMTVNRYVLGVKRIFKWAVAHKYAPASVHQELTTVEALVKGRCAAKDRPPIRPVPQEKVDAVLPYLSRQMRSMVELQLLTAMRPGEVCVMRACDIDMTNPNCWRYRPHKHKGQHAGRDRIVPLVPEAQDIVRKFLKPDLQAYLFTAEESLADWREQRRQRFAKSSPKKLAASRERSARHRKVRGTPRFPFRPHISVPSYERAIKRACQIAFGMPAELNEPKARAAVMADTKEARAQRRLARELWNRENTWHPHQIRHSAATFLRKHYGIEVARAVCGHRSIATTEIYAELDMERIEKVLAEVGWNWNQRRPAAGGSE